MSVNRREGQTDFCLYIRNTILMEYQYGVCCKVTSVLSLEEFVQKLEGYYRGNSCLF